MVHSAFCTGTKLVQIYNLCFLFTFIKKLKYFKCNTSTFIYTNKFNQYLVRPYGKNIVIIFSLLVFIYLALLFLPFDPTSFFKL